MSRASSEPYYRVHRIEADATRDLRHEVLRRGLPRESTRYRGDELELTGHFAVSVVSQERTGESAGGERHCTFGHGDSIVAVGTILPDPPPWDPRREHAWRIRGMATKEGFRGRGLGRMVLQALIEHAFSHRGNLVWCNARVGALSFYARAGFIAFGEPFDDGVAVHRRMQLEPINLPRRRRPPGR